MERELVQRGDSSPEGVGMDYAQSLVDEASVAGQGGRTTPLTYVQSNVNDGAFPEGEFGPRGEPRCGPSHRVHRPSVPRRSAACLTDDGWFVSVDYVGPHRNQYRADAWEEVWRLNGELPPSIRQELVYPSIDLMLVADPTGGHPFRAYPRDLPPLLFDGPVRRVRRRYCVPAADPQRLDLRHR